MANILNRKNIITVLLIALVFVSLLFVSCDGNADELIREPVKKGVTDPDKPTATITVKALWPSGVTNKSPENSWAKDAEFVIASGDKTGKFQPDLTPVTPRKDNENIASYAGIFTALEGGTQIVDAHGQLAKNAKAKDINGNEVQLTNASGEWIYEGDELAPLYAHFDLSAANSYTIKFDVNDGLAKEQVDPIILGFDESRALPTIGTGTSAKFTRAGYTFKGWTTDTNINKPIYTDGQNVQHLTETNGAVITMYAVWDGNNYTMNFVSKGNETDPLNNKVNPELPTDVSVKNGELYTTYTDINPLAAADPVLVGYDFGGWYTDDSFKDKYKVDLSSDTIEFTEDDGATVTVYAKWKPKEITITIDKNFPADADTTDASGDGKMIVYYADKYVTEYDPVVSLKDYTCIGYTKTTATNSPVVIDGATLLSTVDIAGYVKNKQWATDTDITLYAKWEKGSTFTVTFHTNYPKFDKDGELKWGNGGITKTVTFKPSDTKLSEVPTPEDWPGYEFVSWYYPKANGDYTTNTNTDFEEFKDTDVYGTTTDLDVYAYWKAKEYKIILKPNAPKEYKGTVPADHELTEVYNTNVVLPYVIDAGFTDILNENYTFMGWSFTTNSSLGAWCTPVQYTDNTVVIEKEKDNLWDGEETPEEVVLYALWKKGGLSGMTVETISENTIKFDLGDAYYKVASYKKNYVEQLFTGTNILGARSLTGKNIDATNAAEKAKLAKVETDSGYKVEGFYTAPVGGSKIFDANLNVISEDEADKIALNFLKWRNGKVYWIGGAVTLYAHFE